MKRLMTALASIALIGTLFVGAPKPTFAAVNEIYYIGIGGGSSTGCGVPDIMISEDDDIPYNGADDGDDLPDYRFELRDGYEDFHWYDLDGAIAFALTFVDDGDVIQLCESFENQDGSSGIWYANNDASLFNGDQNGSESIIDPIDLTIQGLGTNETVLDGSISSLVRLFNFANINLTLKDMTLQHGDADSSGNEQGGAIFLDYGSLTIDNVDFTDFASGGGGGQFVYVLDADLTVIDSSFGNNDSYTRDGPNDGSGGAIKSDVLNVSFPNTTVSIINSTFNNLGTRDDGGALWLRCANTTIESSLFEDNTAGHSGGSIWTEGTSQINGGGCNTRGSLSVEGSFFDGNYIHEDFGGEGGVGGAVASVGQPVTFIDSTVGAFSGMGGSGNWNNDGNGGALFVDGTSGTLLTITDTDFFDNSSGWDSGGAIYASCTNVVITGDAVGSAEDVGGFGPITSSTFYQNTSYDDGGAIYLDAENCYDGLGSDDDYVSATIDGVVFYTNSTTSGNGYGGAISTNNSGFNWLELVDIRNSTFDNNASYESRAGVLRAEYSHVEITDSYFEDNFSDDGAGVADICGGNLTITDSAFVDNHSHSDGGAVNINDGCGRNNGGNLTVVNSLFNFNGAGNNSDGGALYVDFGNQIVNITNSEFNDNTSGADGGAAVFEDATTSITASIFDGNRAGGHGGAIHLDGSNSLTVRTSSFTDNSSGYEESGSYDGGAIDFSADDSDAYFGVFDSVFEDNFGTDEGGAIWFSLNDIGVGGLLEIFRTRFILNTSIDAGGALFVELGDEGTLTVDRSTFTDNSTGNDGGAINQDTEDRTTGVRITNSSFTGNFADSDGGALDLTDRTLLANNLFVGNMTRRGDGGAVELNRSNPDNSLPYLHIVTNNTFRNNYAGDDGGAVATSGRTLVTGNTFEKNTAEDDGGALELGDGDGHMVSGNRFTDNVAEDDGGAVEAEDDVVVSSNVFANNYAEDNGGALSVEDEARITKNMFINNRSSDNGGAIYADDLGFPESSITDNLLEGNSAVNNGGAMWIDDDEGVMDHKVVIASNRIIRNTAMNGAGIYVTHPTGSASGTQLMSGIIRNSFERNVASQNGGGIMMQYRGGTFSNARAALAALKKAVKNNRYKANKANLDRATGDIGGFAITIEGGSLEAVEAVKAPEAPSVR